MKKLKLVSVGFCMVFTLWCALTYITGCTTPQVVTNPDGSTSTNQVVHPKLTAGLETGHAINAASAPLNPWWPIVSGALASIGVIATAVAKVKTDQKNSVQGQLRSVIVAVNAKDDQKLKDEIQEQAVADGTETALNKTVKSVGSGLI